jgi:hypothetical protein
MWIVNLLLPLTAATGTEPLFVWQLAHSSRPCAAAVNAGKIREAGNVSRQHVLAVYFPPPARRAGNSCFTPLRPMRFVGGE